MNELYIYNPFTCDHLELPGSTLYLDKQQVFGFGFHPCTKEYKVVKIVYYVNALRALSPRENSTVKISEAYILTLQPQGSSSTTSRSIGKFPYSMSIDLADEQLREVLIPDCEEFKGMCLEEIRRENSWSREFYIGDYVPRRLELEPDVDPSFSLSKLYNRRGHVKMLCLLKSGEILMEYKYRVLVSYDPKSGTFKDLSFPGMLNWFETFVHVGSLNWIDTLIDM
ncbi:hypothetical protein ACOSQ2_002848 [Xanthoceras sorbifolium]